MTVDSPTSNLSRTTCAKGDIPATHHYWSQQDQSYLSSIQPETLIKVSLPNASCITATSQGQLPLSKELSHVAKKAIILPKLQSSSLTYLGQLCDDDCNIF